MTTTNKTIAIPNFAEPKFYGVDSAPNTMIVELSLANGSSFAFCITPAALKDFAARCFAQAALHLGDGESDDALPAIEGRMVN